MVSLPPRCLDALMSYLLRHTACLLASVATWFCSLPSIPRWWFCRCNRLSRSKHHRVASSGWLNNFLISDIWPKNKLFPAKRPNDQPRPSQFPKTIRPRSNSKWDQSLRRPGICFFLFTSALGFQGKRRDWFLGKRRMNARGVSIRICNEGGKVVG